MKEQEQLGYQLRTLCNLVDRRLFRILKENGAEDVTPVHSLILDYLDQNRGRAVYQRDIESNFDITRSTVTSVLNRMEQKGYICREAVEHDARLKQVAMTPCGEETLSRIRSSLLRQEELLRSAMSEADYRRLVQVLQEAREKLQEE